MQKKYIAVLQWTTRSPDLNTPEQEEFTKIVLIFPQLQNSDLRLKMVQNQSQTAPIFPNVHRILYALKVMVCAAHYIKYFFFLTVSTQPKILFL